MSAPTAFLLVRAGTRRIGLPITHVVEVAAPGQIYSVPSVEPAMRGVATVRGRIVPVVHLGAFVEGTPCPPEASDTGVILALDGRHVCLEVDEAESVALGAGLSITSAAALPWAVGVVQHAKGLVPLLDLNALATHLGSQLAARFAEGQPA